MNPAIVEAVPVSKALVADAMAALQAARRYPKELPKRVGDLETWCRDGESRLRTISSALAASAAAVEAAGLWLGPDDTRPSRRVPTAALQENRTELAAIILGQRHLPATLPDALKPFFAAGAVLTRWPPDVVRTFCHSARALRAIAARGGSRKLLNHPDVITAGIEYCRASAFPDPAALGPLVSLASMFERLGPRAGQSPARAAFAGLAGRACAFSDPATVMGCTGWWLNALRTAFPQKGGETALDAAVWSMQYWLAATRWFRPNLERLFAVLPEIAPRLIGKPDGKPLDLAAWSNVVYSYGILGQLAALTPDEQHALMERGPFPDATYVLRTRPERLGTLLSLPSHWFAAGGDAKQPMSWASLVLLPDERRVSRLATWLDARLSTDDPSRLLGFLGELFYGLGFSGTGPESIRWQALLERNAWLCSDLLKRYPWAYSFGDCIYALFAVLGEREKYAPGASLRTLATALLRDPELPVAPTEYLELCNELAGADDTTFLRLLRSPAVSASDEAGDPRGGWSFLNPHPAVRGFLSQCAGQDLLAGRAWRVLRCLDLALRLQSRTAVDALVTWWSCPEAPALPGLPADLPPALAERLGLLAAYRRDALPRPILALLEQPETRRKEIDRLRDMQRRAALPDRARLRLAHLERGEAERSSDGGRNAEPLRRACEKNLVFAKLEALEAGLREAIDEHWKRIGLPPGKANDNPDWQNALHIYVNTRGNRRLLRKLLLEEAQGNRAWIVNHPANAAFLDGMRASGLDANAWLAPPAERREIDGNVWTVYAETEPLRVLQMGNIFSTCLGAGGVNAFSTVANAVEVNKRVLYIRNERGAIIGRRLIGIGKHEAGPVLVGFRPYGACDHEGWSVGSAASPWVRILFDVFCSRLARDVGAVFTADFKILDAASETLPLFAKWYNDGPYPFDSWTADPRTRDLVLAGDRAAVAETLFAPDANRAATIRALLWLGDDVIPLLEERGESTFTSAELMFLARFTPGPAARSLLASWISRSPCADPGASVPYEGIRSSARR